MGSSICSRRVDWVDVDLRAARGSQCTGQHIERGVCSLLLLYYVCSFVAVMCFVTHEACLIMCACVFVLVSVCIDAGVCVYVCVSVRVETGCDQIVHVPELLTALCRMLSSNYAEVRQRVCRSIANLAVNRMQQAPLLLSVYYFVCLSVYTCAITNSCFCC